MKRIHGLRRNVVVLLLVVFSFTTLFGQTVRGARDGCQFDRSQASLETALNFYGSLDWTCAIDVLKLVLERDRDELDDNQMAQAYFLLAAATYQYRTEAGQATETVKDTVVVLAARGYVSSSDWSGPYFAQVPQYLKWVEEGRVLAESGALTKGKRIPPWWQAGLFMVGTIAVIAVASSTNTDEKEATLPDFPEPPGGGK